MSLQSYFTRSLLICPKCPNHPSVCQVNVHDYFFETSKKQICTVVMQLLKVPLSWVYQKLPKTIEPPPKVNIEQATAICLKKLKKKLLPSGCIPIALMLRLNNGAVSTSELATYDIATFVTLIAKL